jgi:hypothetical protein
MLGSSVSLSGSQLLHATKRGLCSVAGQFGLCSCQLRRWQDAFSTGIAWSQSIHLAGGFQDELYIATTIRIAGRLRKIFRFVSVPSEDIMLFNVKRWAKAVREHPPGVVQQAGMYCYSLMTSIGRSVCHSRNATAENHAGLK